MTVCVAAICDGVSVLGASDRMLTSGDVEFEPPQEKIYTITNSIAALIAGDSSLQLQLVQQMQSEVAKRIEEKPDEWLRVRDIALAYHAAYKQEQKRRAHSALLTPLGLDENSFIAKQQQMSDSLVKQLASEIISFDMPAIETIVTGLDGTGPHIYVVTNRGITCNDAAGFAAIGVGYWHANSQFMFAEHAPSKPMAQTLLLAYAAKRRAEVAPGVGEATDMFMIGPAVGSYFKIGDHVLGKLKEIYTETRSRANMSQQLSNKEVESYVEELGKSAAVPEQRATPEDPGPKQEVVNGDKKERATAVAGEAGEEAEDIVPAPAK
jgi:20S proteasome alpha/beta subunit